LLASGNLHPAQRSIEGIPPAKLPFMGYVPLGFLPMADGRMYPTYPMGLPISILGNCKVFGWMLGPAVTMALYAIGCLVAIYVLGVELKLGRELSFLATIFLCCCPLFLFMTLQTMSDMPATLWATLAVIGCLKAERKTVWAAFAGFSFVFGVLVRPTSFLMLLPLACVFPWSIRRLAAFCVGAAPGAICVIALNRILYGHILTTGYGNVFSSFGIRYVPSTLHNYIVSLPVELTPLVLLFVAFPFVKLELREAVRIGLIAWVITFFAFYATYFCTHEAWWYLRFVLPTYPAIIIGILFVIKRIGTCIPLPFKFIGWIALVGFISFSEKSHSVKLSALDIGNGEKVYPDTCAFITRSIPDTAVIFCMQESGAIFYYTEHRIVRWDCISADNFTAIESACAQARRRIYMVLFPFEEEAALKKFHGATWKRIGTVRFVSVWELRASDGS
jgi:hypothetical protein